MTNYHEELESDLKKEWIDCVKCDFAEVNGLSDRVYSNALTILYSISDKLSKPEISVLPSGAVHFEWYNGKGRTFIICANKSNKLYYVKNLDEHKCNKEIKTSSNYIKTLITKSVNEVMGKKNNEKHKITIKLDDELYNWICEIGKNFGKTIEAVIIDSVIAIKTINDNDLEDKNEKETDKKE